MIETGKSDATHAGEIALSDQLWDLSSNQKVINRKQEVNGIAKQGLRVAFGQSITASSQVFTF